MRNYKVCIFCLLAFSFIGCSAKVVQKIPSTIEKEEYEVFSTLLNKDFVASKNKSTLIIIQDHTILDNHDLRDVNKTLKYFQIRVPARVLENFIAKNEKTYPLKKLFNIKTKYKLISERELGAIMKQEGYKGLRKKYPTFGVLEELSRVGFNEKKDQALVYVGGRTGGKCGAGDYVYLIKQNGQWIIKRREISWIS